MQLHLKFRYTLQALHRNTVRTNINSLNSSKCRWHDTCVQHLQLESAYLLYSLYINILYRSLQGQVKREEKGEYYRTGNCTKLVSATAAVPGGSGGGGGGWVPAADSPHPTKATDCLSLRPTHRLMEAQPVQQILR